MYIYIFIYIKFDTLRHFHELFSWGWNTAVTSQLPLVAHSISNQHYIYAVLWRATLNIYAHQGMYKYKKYSKYVSNYTNYLDRNKKLIK